jgi:DNA-binding MarR family transcriptional regulator
MSSTAQQLERSVCGSRVLTPEQIERIRSIYRSTDITIADLARRFGAKRSTIGRVVNGVKREVTE